MSTTVRIYWHPPGTAPANPTLWATRTDADDGAFSFADIDTTGMLSGNYDITVTREVTTPGLETTESQFSNAQRLTIEDGLTLPGSLPLL